MKYKETARIVKRCDSLNSVEYLELFSQLQYQNYTRSRFCITFKHRTKKATSLDLWPEKVRLGNDKETAQPESNSLSKKRDGKTKLTIRHLYVENIP